MLLNYVPKKNPENMKNLLVIILLACCVVCAAAQGLSVYKSPQKIKFPNGYDVVDNRGVIVKRLPDARSANVQAYSDSNGIRYYMSDWSYQRYREKGIKPNWIRGRVISSKSATPNVMGSAKWRPLPYWYNGKFFQYDPDLVEQLPWEKEAYALRKKKKTLYPFNEALKKSTVEMGKRDPLFQSNLLGDYFTEHSPWQDSVMAKGSLSGGLVAIRTLDTLKVWDVSTRQCVWTIRDVHSFFWISGDRLVTHYHHGRSDYGYLRICDVRNKKIIDTKEKASDSYYSKSLNKAVFNTSYDDIFVFDFSNDEKIFGDWADWSSSASNLYGGSLNNDRYAFIAGDLQPGLASGGEGVLIDLKDYSSLIVKNMSDFFELKSGKGAVILRENGEVLSLDYESKKMKSIGSKRVTRVLKFKESVDGGRWWSYSSDGTVCSGAVENAKNIGIWERRLSHSQMTNLRIQTDIMEMVGEDIIYQTVTKTEASDPSWKLFHWSKSLDQTICLIDEGFHRLSVNDGKVYLSSSEEKIFSPTNRSFQDVAKSVDGINLPKGMDFLCKLSEDLIVCSLSKDNPVKDSYEIPAGFGLFDSSSARLVGFFGSISYKNWLAREERRLGLHEIADDGNHGWDLLDKTGLSTGVFDAGQSGEVVRWRDQEFDLSKLKWRKVVTPLTGNQYLPDQAKVSMVNPTWEDYIKDLSYGWIFGNNLNHSDPLFRYKGYSVEAKYSDFLSNSSPMLLGAPPRQCQVSTFFMNSWPSARMWSSPSGRLVAVRDGHRGWNTVLIDTIEKKLMVQYGQSSGLDLAHQDEQRGGQSLFKPLDDTGEKVAVAAGNHLYIIDYKHGKILSQEWCQGGEATCSADGSKIFVDTDGSIGCYEYDMKGVLSKTFQLYTDELGRWVMATKDGYYMTRGGEKLVSISLHGVAQAFSTDQFSLRLNRPDILLERIGAPDEAIAIARKMRAKRLKRMEVTEDMLRPEFHLPELDIMEEVPLTSSKDTITIPVKARDSLYKLERLKVYINNVPVNGRDGVSLRKLATQQLSRDIPIKLASGRNKIQISVVNRAGAESLYANIEVTCTSPLPQPALYCVALGVSSYDNPEFDLRYAAKDARDITATLHSCEGDSYREVKSLCLTDKEVTREALVRITDFLSLAGVNDTVIFYVAGHGLLDDDYDYYYGTTDIDFDNPERRGVSFDELDDIMAGVSCLKKSMWIDTCHAGELDEEERTLLAANSGAVASLPGSSGVAIRSVGKRGMSIRAIETATTRSVWYERLQGLFVDLRRGSGTTVITSSAGAEYALESSRQKNGLFTYALIEALKGAKAADANKDGSIVMSEVTDYVKKRVEELSRGKQTPNVRRVNLEGDFVISVGDE